MEKTMAENTTADAAQPTSALSAVPIWNISTPLWKRDIDQAHVDRLVESISEIGLLSPIVVRRTGRPDIMDLVAGQHRLEAMKRLGRREIQCLVVSDADLQAELMAIDENLCRAELWPPSRGARKSISLCTPKRQQVSPRPRR
jgi:ParB/RepB/Spo0J family partition protein